jgi:methylated-DNA-[protein]-cysteine S-methyltransferase
LPHLSLHTQAGAMTLFEQDGAIVALDWGWAGWDGAGCGGAGPEGSGPQGFGPEGVGEQAETPVLRAGRDQLHAWFDGEIDHFDLPLAPVGTAYRRRVWQALCDIPYGAMRTYGEIVAVAGGSARSVGQANAANPIPILIPCHRVLAAGHLGGYSAGEGLATKRLLLAIEQDRTRRLGAAPPPRSPRLQGDTPA